MSEYVKISRENYDKIIDELQRSKKENETLKDGGHMIKMPYDQDVYSILPVEECILKKMQELETELDSSKYNSHKYLEELYSLKNMGVIQFKSWKKIKHIKRY